MLAVRQSARLMALGLFLAKTLVEGAARKLVLGRGFDHAARSRWLQNVCRKIARIVHLEIITEGEPPKEGLVMCNHLGYLDIIALGAVTPLVFLSKREVQGWPLIGAITRLAGTLYIKREEKKEVVRVAEEFETVVGKGTTVVIFPEGTSSDGKGVLPFRSALLEPAVRGQWPVTPARLDYGLVEGSVADEVCYWRDMTFFPHLLNLLRKEKVLVRVRFGRVEQPGTCRKVLAAGMRDKVCALGTNQVWMK